MKIILHFVNHELKLKLKTKIKIKNVKKTHFNAIYTKSMADCTKHVM
jgi:hypothetical protein